MADIEVFQKEIEDGVGELVKSTASVAYCSQAEVKGRENDLKNAMAHISNTDVIGKVVGENKNQIDLYYLESVLVSTGWNKNDDVFTSQATWDARNTPEDKQFNFMHDENDIIGHITGSYVLSKDGKRVTSDEKPNEFDIITQAVLYNSWTEEENRDRMKKIISEIEEGKWYVSMECLFAGFDYALIDKSGKAKVLSRDEQSSFLTKHLRAYGGNGEYEGYKIGRALKNIAFSGKGLVTKPANPRSVILNKDNTSKAFILEDSSNTLSLGEIAMSDNLVLEKQIADLKSALASTEQENKEIKARIEEAKDREFASKVESFESTIQDKQSTIAELEEAVKSAQARIAELEDALKTSQSELALAVKNIGEMKKKEKMEKRMAALTLAGLAVEDAQITLVSLENLDDEAFDSVVAVMKKKSVKKDKEEEKKEDVKEEDTEATAEVFEAVETSEATLVELVVNEADSLESTRASLSQWISSNVLSK
jgi:hypothetical protein